MIKRAFGVLVSAALAATTVAIIAPAADAAPAPASTTGHAHADRAAGGKLRPAVAAPSGYAVRGVDVSQFNETVDWPAVAGSNVKFAYVRAGTADENNALLTDSSYATNVAGARSAGLAVGAYYFARPDSEDVGSLAPTQADHFASLLAGRNLDLPAFVDLEFAPSDPVCWHRTPDSMVRWIKQFTDEFQAKVGYAPMVYTSKTFWEQCAGNSPIFDDLSIDIATYGPAPTLPSGLSHYDFWQYTDDATDVNGRATTCGDNNNQTCPIDGMVFHGSAADLAYFAANKPGTGVATVAGAGGSYQVFGVNSAGALRQGTYVSGRGWTWRTAGSGGVVRGTPGITYTATGNRYDAFAVGTNGVMYQKTFSINWGGWHAIGGRNFTGGVSAVVVISNQPAYYVYGVTRSGYVWQGFYKRGYTAWTWQNLGPRSAQVRDTAGVSNLQPGYIAQFAVRRDGVLLNNSVASQPWATIGGSSLVGGTATTTPDHVFAINSAGLLYHGIRGANHVFGFQNLGGTVVGTPAARYTGGRYDLFAVGTNGAVYQKIYAGGRWTAYGKISNPDFT